MTSPVTPLPGYVFVKPNTTEAKTASGIILPETAKEKPKTAQVVAVGEGVRNVKVGDTVIYKDDYSNVDFPINKIQHTIVKEEYIVAKVK